MTSITGNFETKFRSKEPGIKENPEMEDFFQDFWLGSVDIYFNQR
ncbi:hypothetical protein [Wolbachia endosymbiont (group A) of Ennomos erosarius]